MQKPNAYERRGKLRGYFMALLFPNFIELTRPEDLGAT